MLETNEKRESFSKEIEILSKEMEDIKKKQMEILELEKYNNQIKKLSGWTQYQKREGREKTLWN